MSIVALPCYLASLRFNNARVIYLQPYHTLQEVLKLALKVEVPNRYRSFTTTRSVAKEEFAKDSTAMSPSDTRTSPKSQVTSEVHKSEQESTSKSKCRFNLCCSDSGVGIGYRYISKSQIYQFSKFRI